MAKWSNEKIADLTRKLADTAIDYKQRCEVLEERWEAACQDAKEAEAYAEELEAKLKTSEEIGRAFEEDAGQLRKKLAKLIEHAIEFGRWDLNPSFRDDLIDFSAELKGQDDE